MASGSTAMLHRLRTSRLYVFSTGQRGAFSAMRLISAAPRLRPWCVSPWRYCPFRLPGGLAPPCNRQRPFFVAMPRAKCDSDDSRAMWSWGVRMPERATGGDAVADELFDLFEFRKAALLLPRPDDLVINAHLKDATGPIRGERHGAKLLGKRGQ